MYKAKVYGNDQEYDDNMYLNGFIDLCEIRKMIENKEKECG